MPINNDKTPLKGDYVIVASYTPVKTDGSRGAKNEIQLAWDGSKPSRAEAKRAVQNHLDRLSETFGGGPDIICSVGIVDNP